MSKEDNNPVDKSNGDDISETDVVDFYKSCLFRCITLLLYVSTVSAFGLTLALYYFFIWDSKMPPIPHYKANSTHTPGTQLH